MSSINRIPYDWPNREISRSAQIGGLIWHFQISGKGPLILLLHGTGSSTHSWGELTPLLNKEAQVLNVDLPGHAFTLGASVDSLKLEQIASDLIALLQELKMPWPTMVVGHSAGAPLALAFAQQAPVKPQVIIGLNPSLIPPPPSYTQFFWANARTRYQISNACFSACKTCATIWNDRSLIGLHQHQSSRDQSQLLSTFISISGACAWCNELYGFCQH